MRRLEAFGHIAVEPGGGRRRSNRITLILKPAASLQVETPAGVPPFSRENPGSHAGVSDGKTPAAVTENPGSGVAKPRQRCHPNFYKNNFRTSTTTADTEAGAPRQRADALGALDEKLRRLIEPAEFRSWFVTGEAELIEQTADTVTIAVKAPLYAEQIFNRYEPVIARAAGVQFVRIEVRQPAARAAP